MIVSFRLAVLLGAVPVCFLNPLAAAAEVVKRQSEVHLKFDGNTSEPKWTSQNDNVMGGRSQGGAVLSDGVLAFTGSLSLENNGGFAQVRIQNLAYDLSGKKGVKLRVRGDGRTYQLLLATDARHRGSRIAYSVEGMNRGHG